MNLFVSKFKNVVKGTNRAIYNLTGGGIVLPFAFLLGKELKPWQENGHWQVWRTTENDIRRRTVWAAQNF